MVVGQFAAGFLPRSLCERHVDEAVNTRRAKSAKVLYARDPGHVVESNALYSEIHVPDVTVTSRASTDRTRLLVGVTAVRSRWGRLWEA